MSRPTSPSVTSAIAGISWPPVVLGTAATLLAYQQQLSKTERWTAEQLSKHQLAQFGTLAVHAYEHSPFHRLRFDHARLPAHGAWTQDRFSEVPILTRRDFHLNEGTLWSRAVPETHGVVRTIRTSGSTGQVISVRNTEISQLKWMALGLRDHEWYERDPSRTMAVIRANGSVVDGRQAAEVGWGPPLTTLGRTGPSFSRPLGTDVADQVDWLVERSPSYLLTYPTNLGSLVDVFERRGSYLPDLVHVRTIGEALSPHVRARVRDVLGVPVVDSYSAAEVGAIALQCPDWEELGDDPPVYHVHAESLIVEVLDDEGRQCAPGEVGKVVVTDLHNFATPIIRYELGDLAEVGRRCHCGRGLPTLNRILGRTRNMAVLPGGRRVWPLIGSLSYREVAPIAEYQLVQHSLAELEMRLVVEGGGSLSSEQESQLTFVVRRAIGHAFDVRFTYFEGHLPRGAGDKLEDFVCLVT